MVNGDEAGSPAALRALQSAGSPEGSRRTATAFIGGSERHRSLQEGEGRLGRCPPRMFGGDDPTRHWQGSVVDGDLEPQQSPHQLAVGVLAGVEAMAPTLISLDLQEQIDGQRTVPFVGKKLPLHAAQHFRAGGRPSALCVLIFLVVSPPVSARKWNGNQQSYELVLPDFFQQLVVNGDKPPVSANDNAKVLINYDEGNAHNEVDRHTFLVRMREVARGLCKWLEFIYPTDVATRVLSWTRHSFCSGGQQDCPLIGACHALVKRMVHESLGLVAPLAGSQIQLPRIDPPIILDIAPTSADDGVIAGDEPEVLRAIQHMKRVMPLVELRFSMMQVVAAAAGTQDP